jgi:hypothetical protein
MDLRWSVTIVLEEEFDYSLSGKEITLRIQKKTDATGVYLLDQDTTDGNITVDDLTISVNIPAADIVAAGIEEEGEYDFGLTIGEPIDGNRIQADFFAIEETGIVPEGFGSYEVGLVSMTVEVALVVGGTGPQGPQGPAGPWLANVRTITVSGAITAADQTVEIAAGGDDISVALPTAAELFDSGKTLQIRLKRLSTDTGAVALTGAGAGKLNNVFLPGDSILIESNDSELLIYW